MRKRVKVSDGSYAYVTYRKAQRRPLGDVALECCDRLVRFTDRMWAEHETAMGVLTMIIICGLILFTGFIEGSDWPC